MLRIALRSALTIAAVLALAGEVAWADPITFTGNVAADFNPATNATVNVFTHSNDPYHLPSPAWTPSNWISGFSIRDIRTDYDPKTDTMYVGVNTFAAAGNIVNNGSAPLSASLLASQGLNATTIDPPNLGANDPNSDKSITVAFAPPSATNPGQPGAPALVAGVPANKAQQGPGLDGFTVNAYKETGLGVQQDYGAPLTSHNGGLAFDPSTAHPGFEFAITNFSQGTGLDPTQPLWLSVYAGSARSLIGSKDTVPWSRIPAPQPQLTPEPSTIVAWTALAAAAAVGLRRRRRSAAERGLLGSLRHGASLRD
jgi:MYXO-CTERM domain-containing protein